MRKKKFKRDLENRSGVFLSKNPVKDVLRHYNKLNWGFDHESIASCAETLARAYCGRGYTIRAHTDYGARELHQSWRMNTFADDIRHGL